MNTIKKIKQLQGDKYDKTNSHQLIGNASENDIVKLVPNQKIASVCKIKTKSWEHLFDSQLKITNFTTDKYEYTYFTGYFNENISIKDQYDNIIDLKLSENNSKDIFVAKVKKSKLIYIKTVPGLNIDKAFSIIVDNAGDIYISGYFTDSITFDTIYLSTEGNNQNIFVAKLNGKTQEWIWAKSAGHEYYNSKCKCMCIYNDYIYVCGYFNKYIKFDTIPIQEFNTSGINIFIAKMNAYNGDWEWITTSEGDGIVKPKYMEIKDKKIYITGYLKGHIIFGEELDNLCKNIFITGLNIKGNWIFEETFHGEESYGQSLKIDKEGYIYIIGNFKGKIEINDIILESYDKNNSFILKLNYFGNLIWLRHLKSSKSLCYDMQLDIQNFLYIVGTFQNEMQIVNNMYQCSGQKPFILKISNNGNIIFCDICESYLTNIQIYNFNGFYLGGYDIVDTYTLIKYIPDDRLLKCLGIIRTPGYSHNNDNVDIEFNGTISQGYKNLEAGFDYYIQDGGNLDTIPNDYYFGTALTENKLLLKF